MKITEETFNSLCETVGTLLAVAACLAFLLVVGTATCSGYRYVKHSYPVHSLDEPALGEKE